VPEFAGYTYRERLHVTEYGEVFRAAGATGQSVRVTHVASELASLPGFEEAFLSRGERLGMLEHASVEPVLMVGKAPTGVLVAVTADAPGSVSLESVLGDVRGGGMPMMPSVAAAIGRSLVGAVAHAHGAELAHGAVHPRSVRVYADGAVRLGDFAIGQALRAVLTAPGGGAARRFVDDFLPLELATGDRTGAADDVWAVGVLLHRMFGGRLPPAPLRRVDALSEVIERAHAERPSERYPTGIDLRAAFKSALTDSSVRRAAPAEVAAFARGAAAHAAAASAKIQAAPPPGASAEPEPAPADAEQTAVDEPASADGPGSDPLDDLLAELPDIEPVPEPPAAGAALASTSTAADAADAAGDTAAVDDVLSLLEQEQAGPESVTDLADEGWTDYALRAGGDPDDDTTTIARDDKQSAATAGAALDDVVNALEAEETGEVTSVDPDRVVGDDPVSDMLRQQPPGVSTYVRLGDESHEEDTYIPPPMVADSDSDLDETAARVVAELAAAHPRANASVEPPAPAEPPPPAPAVPATPPALDLADPGTLMTADAPRGGGGRMWMAVALMAFVALGVVLYTQTDLFFPERRRAKEEAARRAHEARQREIDAARVRTGEILIDSSPGEAAVWLSLGRTPTETIPLPASVVHQIRVEHEGFRSRDLNVTEAAWAGSGKNQTAVVRAELKLETRRKKGPRRLPAAPAAPNPSRTGRTGGGVVRVESEPPGAQAYLLVGFTPAMSLKGVQAGLGYELKLVKDGHSPAFVVVRPEDWAVAGSETDLATSVSVSAELVPLEK